MDALLKETLTQITEPQEAIIESTEIRDDELESRVPGAVHGQCMMNVNGLNFPLHLGFCLVYVHRL